MFYIIYFSYLLVKTNEVRFLSWENITLYAFKSFLLTRLLETRFGLAGGLDLTYLYLIKGLTKLVMAGVSETNCTSSSTLTFSTLFS